jgi:hypothetical protein
MKRRVHGFRDKQFRGHGNGSDRGPLRKVVGHKPTAHGSMWEVLECGHWQPPRSDLVGETNAQRRRCGKCKRGLPPDAPVG